MICLGVSRYYSYQVAKDIVREEYTKADNALKTALSWIPCRQKLGSLCFDLQHIHHLRGDRLLGEAKNQVTPEGARPSPDYFYLLKKARDHYLKAVVLNPYDIKPAKGLAESTFLLEKALLRFYPGKENPYNALSCYEKLAELRPNGLTVHYMMARYFYFKGMDDALARAVSHIAFLYPNDAVNKQIQKEEFYSSRLDPAMVQGVKQAIAEKRYLRRANLVMARLVEKDSDFIQALEYQQRGMAIKMYRNSVYDYIRLGRLFLDIEDNKASYKAFDEALAVSNDFTAGFKRIYHVFHKKKADRAFLEFAGNLESKRKQIPVIVSLRMARADINLKLYEQARQRLAHMIEDRPDPEAFYLLAIAAEQQAQWDDMEVNIQKASSLDPDECRYYSKFAKALFKQGKNIQAKFQQEKARACKALQKN